jgi:peptidoglycan L-alanyl-D-glutamate endopeptidase CwlK
LQTLFNEVIRHYDCRILCGHRNESDQNQAVVEGKSKTPWPRSQHNAIPSMAIDVAPYPIDWKDTERFYYFGGYVQGIAKMLLETGRMTHRVRWGGDWDSDHDLHDQRFMDLVHFELRPVR